MAGRGSTLQSFLDPAEEQILKTTKTLDWSSNSFCGRKLNRYWDYSCPKFPERVNVRPVAVGLFRKKSMP
jgi:hypothetical protein